MENVVDLREIREAREVSQRTLSVLSGVDRRTIQRIEQGDHEPSRKTQRRLLDALGIPHDGLRDSGSDIDHDDGVYWEIEHHGCITRCTPYYPDHSDDPSDEEYECYLEELYS